MPGSKTSGVGLAKPDGVPIFILDADPKSAKVAVITHCLISLGRRSSTLPNMGVLQTSSRGLRSGCVVIIPDSDPASGHVEQAVSLLQSGGLNAFVVFASDSISADTYKRLVKTERGDWVEWKSLDDELPALISKYESAASATKSGKIISIVSTRGGIGSTTLAVELGMCLMARKGKNDISILDLNFQDSTLADSLDLPSRLDVSEFVDKPERLDSQLIEVFASRHRSGIDIFSSSPSFLDLPPLSPQALFSLLDALVKRYSITILDLPRQWRPWVDNVLRGSDAIAVVGGTTVPAVRQLAARLQQIESLGIKPERLAIVLNQCDLDVFGRVRRRSEVDRMFQDRRLFYLPRDVRAATEAANTGHCIAEIAPRRPFCREIRRIEEWVNSLS